MDFKYKITLFTPTYNRAYIIDALYRSVQRQTYRNFEWIIIDDGSSDNTEEVVREWIDDNNDFPIRYYKVKNGGKCRAINKGLDLAEGELFFTIDSDDYLTDDALEKVVYMESTVKGDPRFCGIVGNRGNSPTETPNTPLGAPYIDEYAYVRYPEYTDHPVDGERAEVWYTEIHRKYKYPEFDGENFMTEAIAYNRMANDGYIVRYFNDIIWIWEYLEDGLTKQGATPFINNPRGHGLCLKEKAEFLNYSFIKRFKMYYSFYCDHRHHLTSKQIAEYIGAKYILVLLASIIFKVKHFND